MNENKQIEELAATIYTHLRSDSMSRALASLLYEEGWRKQSEGEWEKASEFMPIYRCSICKERNLFKNGNNVFSNFCPNCGAKMKGE